MELVMAAVIAVLVAGGFYLMMRDNLLRVLIGVGLVGQAVNLMILTAGRLERGGPPLLDAAGGPLTDPLPPALILTAIVIGFAAGALLFVIAMRLYQESGLDDLSALRGLEDE